MRTYHFGETNHCPGCGRTQWHVGRTLAECAFCSTALPLSETVVGPLFRPITVRRDNSVWEDAA